MRYKMIYYTKPTGEKVTIAESTFAGRRVKGVSVCNVADTYNKEFGDALAKAKCDNAISLKRVERLNKAIASYNMSIEYMVMQLRKVTGAQNKATARLEETQTAVDQLLLEQ